MSVVRMNAATSLVEEAMDDERRALAAFLSVHAKKASTTHERVAHLHFRSRGDLSLNGPLIRLDEEDVKHALDAASPLVNALLTQLKTYEPTEQRIVGLVFDDNLPKGQKPHVVLSEVMWCPDALRRRQSRLGGFVEET